MWNHGFKTKTKSRPPSHWDPSLSHGMTKPEPRHIPRFNWDRQQPSIGEDLFCHDPGKLPSTCHVNQRLLNVKIFPVYLVYCILYRRQMSLIVTCFSNSFYLNIKHPCCLTRHHDLTVNCPWEGCTYTSRETFQFVLFCFWQTWSSFSL